MQWTLHFTAYQSQNHTVMGTERNLWRYTLYKSIEAKAAQGWHPWAVDTIRLMQAAVWTPSLLLHSAERAAESCSADAAMQDTLQASTCALVWFHELSASGLPTLFFFFFFYSLLALKMNNPV